MSDLTAAQALTLDEALELRPDAAIVAVVGSDALAAAVAVALPSAAVRTHDDLTPVDAPAPDGLIRLPLGADLFRGVELVIAELPKSLGALDELTQLVAQFAAPSVALVAGGRIKDMTRSQNEVLAASFTAVSASLGRSKARALRAERPRENVTSTYPKSAEVSELAFDIVAHGGAFAGTKLDIGTRALLEVLPREFAKLPSSGTVLDLGCGTGVLAVAAAQALPGWRVLASDRSASAVDSARATADRAGVLVEVSQDDAAASIPDTSVDLVLLNPPFHDGHAVIEDFAKPMFRAAARVLHPGGVLLTVFNSHLKHRTVMHRVVGETTQLARTPKFTVTKSVRR